MNLIDTVPAYSLDVDDLTIIADDLITITLVEDDGSEMIITGQSHNTGDSVIYRVLAFDNFDIWGV